MTRWAPTAIAVIVAACGDWPWQHDMVNQPARSVAATARPAPSGSIPWAGLSSSTVRDAATASDAGRSLYVSYCSPCHGLAGAGDGRVSAYFRPMRDLTDPAVLARDDHALFDIVTDGIGRMPPSRHELTVDERWQVVSFLRYMGAPR